MFLVVYWQTTAKRWFLLVSHKQREAFCLNGFGGRNNHGKQVIMLTVLKWESFIIQNMFVPIKRSTILEHYKQSNVAFYSAKYVHTGMILWIQDWGRRPWFMLSASVQHQKRLDWLQAAGYRCQSWSERQKWLNEIMTFIFVYLWMTCQSMFLIQC